MNDVRCNSNPEHFRLREDLGSDPHIGQQACVLSVSTGVWVPSRYPQRRHARSLWFRMGQLHMVVGKGEAQI